MALHDLTRYRHSRLLGDTVRSGATVEDLARAFVSIISPDAVALYDEQRERGETSQGVFVDSVVKMESILERAAAFARARNGK